MMIEQHRIVIRSVRPKTYKSYIICPNCEHSRGVKEILAEVEENGISVLRVGSSPNMRLKTRVVGSEFSVVCGNCNEIVYYRRPNI